MTMQLQQGAWGFPYVIDTGIDLSTATAIKLRIKSPYGGVVERDLNQSAVTAKTEVTYQVEEGDFPVAGWYEIAVIDATPGRNLPSTVGVIDVRETP